MSNEQTTGKDTDEDASFSENEQILSKSYTSDDQQQQQPLTAIEQIHPSSIISTNEIQDDQKIISKTTELSSDESKSQVQPTETQVR